MPFERIIGAFNLAAKALPAKASERFSPEAITALLVSKLNALHTAKLVRYLVLPAILTISVSVKEGLIACTCEIILEESILSPPII
ncbi:hypothetical protein SDC9_173642 [bioreactor metagenome]|uniref:Uncharacterized protein n=1 Tax=bioreactor metagenome TaxID=1076179 RepID=A0A645GH05_9ZZZZ